MKVKVYAPSFCDHSQLDESSKMELPENATVKDVYKRLKIPFILRAVVNCSVNYKKVKMSTSLKDGDVISFLIPVAGG